MFTHEVAPGGGDAAGLEKSAVEAVAGQGVGGEVDASKAEVFGNIAQDIGALHGFSEGEGAGFLGGVLKAEDAGHHEADHAGDVVAIVFQFGFIEDGEGLAVQADAVEQIEQPMFRDSTGEGGVFERGEPRVGQVVGRGGGTGTDPLGKGTQCFRCGLGIGGAVNGVVEVAAEGVESVGAAAFGGGKGDGGEVEAFGVVPGDAAGGLVGGGQFRGVHSAAVPEAGGLSGASIIFQNEGLCWRASSSATGRAERKRKSLRLFLCRTRWMVRPDSIFSK